MRQVALNDGRFRNVIVSQFVNTGVLEKFPHRCCKLFKYILSSAVNNLENGRVRWMGYCGNGGRRSGEWILNSRRTKRSRSRHLRERFILLNNFLKLFIHLKLLPFSYFDCLLDQPLVSSFVCHFIVLPVAEAEPINISSQQQFQSLPSSKYDEGHLNINRNNNQ